MDLRASRVPGVFFGLLAMVISGCAGTPSTRYFVMNTISGSEEMLRSEGETCFTISIGPVKLPEYLNHPEIVTRITPNEVKMAENALWAEPLEHNISRSLAENLPSLLCIRAIFIFPWKKQISVDYRVDVHIIRMDGVLGEVAILDVFWSITDGGDSRKSPVFSKRTRYEEPAGGEDFAFFVSAQSRNLAALSRDIAATISGLTR